MYSIREWGCLPRSMSLCSLWYETERNAIYSILPITQFSTRYARYRYIFDMWLQLGLLKGPTIIPKFVIIWCMLPIINKGFVTLKDNQFSNKWLLCNEICVRFIVRKNISGLAGHLVSRSCHEVLQMYKYIFPNISLSRQ